MALTGMEDEVDELSIPEASFELTAGLFKSLLVGSIARAKAVLYAAFDGPSD